MSYADLRGLVVFRPLERPLSSLNGEYRAPAAGWTSTVNMLADELRFHGGRRLIAAAGGSWRRAAALAHPDLGGQPDDFRDVIAARDAGET